MRKVLPAGGTWVAGVVLVFSLMLAESWARIEGKKSVRRPRASKESLAPFTRAAKPRSNQQQSNVIQPASGTIIWEDNFEGGQAPWTPAASWTNVPVNSANPEAGFVLGDHSGWTTVDTISQRPPSPAHAWRNDDDEDTAIDLLLSPVIHLPKTAAGEPLIKALVSFYLDLHAPDVESEGLLQDFFFVRAGRAEALWKMDNAAPATGSSHWALRQGASDTRGAFNVQSLLTPEINLAGALAPMLSFMQQYVTEPDFDYCAVDVSRDGFASYRTLASFSGTRATYAGAAIDLKNYSGQKIRLRFRFISDYQFSQPGARWFIDDIAVRDGANLLFSDNGGENGNTAMTKSGFIGGEAEIGLDFDRDPNHSAALWEKKDSATIARGAMDILTSASGIAPGDSIRLAIHWVTNGKPGAGNGRGIFIDDVEITAITGLAHDVVMSDVDVPFPNLAVFAAQSALVRVRNRGFEAQNGVPLRYRVNGGAEATPAPAVNLNVPIEAEVEGAINWSAAAPGIYKLSVYTALPRDGDRGNDTLSVAPITVFPHGLAELGYDDRFNQNVFITAGTCLVNFSVLQDLRNVARKYTLSQIKIDLFNDSETADRVRLVVAAAKDDTTLQQVLFEKIEAVPAKDFSAHVLEINAKDLATERVAVLIDFSVSNGNARLLMDGGRTRFPGHNFFFDGVKWNTSSFGRQVRLLVAWLAPPKIVFVRDVPDDQGKQAQVCWFPSPTEGFSREVAHYVLWRAVKDFGAGILDSTFRIIEVPGLPALYDYGLQKARPGDRVLVSGNGAWDFIVSVPSHPGFEAYCYVAPALIDSNATGVNYTTFMVTAYDKNGGFADSKVDSGYSVDNLAPGVPPGFAAQRVEVNQRPAVQLTWKAVADADLAYYAIYKNGGNMPWAQTPHLIFTDLEVAAGTTVNYSLAAFDVNGNRSAGAKVTLTITSVDEKPLAALPAAYALNDNYPNPFNPQTTIAFALPVGGRVKLSVFNFLGQEVAALIDENLPAGFHRAVWEAKHQPSGIYFYHFVVNDFAQMKKMLLLR